LSRSGFYHPQDVLHTFKIHNTAILQKALKKSNILQQKLKKLRAVRVIGRAALCGG
jgi:hypothetical protein